MAQRDREKSWVTLNSGGEKRNLRLKPGFDEVVFYECLACADKTGFSDDRLIP
jgi:hypothetical protein